MVRATLAWIGLTFLTVSGAFGQLQDNRDKQMNCQDGNRNGRAAHKCDIREQTLASVGQLTLDPNRNGGVSVKGWTQSNVLVRARLEAWGDSDSDASLTFSQIHSDAAAGRVTASGPDGKQWSVSYEIFVPQTHDLKVATTNGGVHISDINGRLDLSTTNGGLHLTRVIGNITAKTTNGGVHVTLAGGNWQGRQLDLETTNGGVHVEAPANFQGHIQAETTNGSVHSDFGGQTAAAGKRARTMNVTVGGGGATLKVVTRNGGIHIGRTEKVI
jgi:DUF4097 and DUF4098 domain-containing protein YvlB